MSQPLLNRVLGVVLRSPLHMVASRSILLLTYAGRTSGSSHTFPVMYVERDGAAWIMVGWPERKRWWRNIDVETPVSLRLRGRDVPAFATRVEGDPTALDSYLARFPRAAKSLGVLGRDKRLDPAAVADLAKRAMFVRCSAPGI